MMPGIQGTVGKTCSYLPSFPVHLPYLCLPSYLLLFVSLLLWPGPLSPCLRVSLCLVAPLFFSPAMGQVRDRASGCLAQGGGSGSPMWSVGFSPRPGKGPQGWEQKRRKQAPESAISSCPSQCVRSCPRGLCLSWDPPPAPRLPPP